jgi:formate dehydrogenase maturation protein FdhE
MNKLAWTYKKPEADVIKVKLKCQGCKAVHTIALLPGESTNETIIGCDKCNKFIKGDEHEND